MGEASLEEPGEDHGVGLATQTFHLVSCFEKWTVLVSPDVSVPHRLIFFLFSFLLFFGPER